MKQLYSKSFQIAGLTILLDSDVEILSGKEFVEFETTNTPDYCILFRKVSLLEEFEEKPIVKETGFQVYSSEQGYRYQFVDTNDRPYAVSTVDWENKTVSVRYLQDGVKHISHTRGAFFHIRWEEMMLNSQRLILHACCVEASKKGILFSGVSGVGKSTQGNLWCKYEKATLINGDRPLLYKDETEWYACGSPYAGSSDCHKNMQVKIHTIVLLEQSEVCSIRKLHLSEAFRKIFAQLTVGAWNPASVSTICSLTEELVNDIPIYEMKCTPDESAVRLLKDTIIGEVDRSEKL